MNLTELVESHGWKNFMKYVYGIGAAIVIMGALFKIMHWPGANFMITAGLSTEAVIFILSVLDPLHEDLDWTLVYPELAGISDPEELEHFKQIPEISMNREVIPVEELAGGAAAATGAAAISDNSKPAENTKKTKSAKKESSNESIQRSSSAGFAVSGESASQMAEISAEATGVTKDYLNNLKKASDALGTLNDAYESGTQTFKDSFGQLTASYENTASKITESGKSVASSYDELAQNISAEQERMQQGNEAYNSQIAGMSDKLSALNAAYELQLESTNNHLKDTDELYKGLGGMVTNLKDSVDETMKYHDAMKELRESISSLNNIYGNMLSAVQVGSKK